MGEGLLGGEIKWGKEKGKGESLCLRTVSWKIEIILEKNKNNFMTVI